MKDEAKSRENEPVAGTLQDYKDLAKSMNQQTCPNCGYCPCCGRPRNNWNYPYWQNPNGPYYWNQMTYGGTHQ